MSEDEDHPKNFNKEIYYHTCVECGQLCINNPFPKYWCPYCNVTWERGDHTNCLECGVSLDGSESICDECINKIKQSQIKHNDS